MRITSVDPGITGALAFFEGGKLQYIYDMPVADGEADGLEIAEWLTEWNPHYVVIEQQQAMPKNGSIAGFKQGLNYGLIVGVAEALRHPVAKIRPPEWKKLNGLTGKDKEASLALARQLYPHKSAELKLKKHHNRAEAALIGRAFGMKHVQEANRE